ncbi:MAG TPA: branched-chain amino acid ABC transporter permease/ATP-binding protein [Acidimicrobiales bacterium]|nr:branched-chain amino acid ABC transporter permease/ATP-binding protein [Acidimicrobiales bacterium]
MNSGTFVLGMLNGLIISLLAVGFVLLYKANRFLNLASAQLGVLSALLLLKFVNDWGWNWWLTFVTCVLVGVATGLLVERFIVAPVRRRTKSPVRLLILTIGISQVLLALTYIPGLAPVSQAPFPQPFSSSVQLGGVVLSGMSLLTLIAVPLLLVLLTVFLEFTSLGKQIRAAAGNPDAARLCGISVSRVSLITWGMAGGLAAFAAILNGPTTSSFNAEALGPFLLMLTMGAAAFGAFVSFPIAVGGGLGLGLVYQIILAQTNNAGMAELAAFAVILLVVLVRGKAIGRAFATEGAAVPERPGLRVPEALRDSPFLKHGVRWLIGLSMLVAAVFPVLPYFKSNQFLLVLVLIYALVGVSLTMVVGWSGQVSLGHFALVGVGAYLTARWAGQWGWSIVELLLVAGMVGAVVMVAIGLPALRVRGLTLAVTTLGLAVIAPDWAYQQGWLGGSTPFNEPVGTMTVLPGIGTIGSQLYLYYVVLVVLVLVVAAGATLRRSSVGRVMIAVRDNERAAASFGISPATVKLRVLALSGFVAASAGVFFAADWQSLSPTLFGSDVSIAVLAIPVIGGLGSIGGAVAAAVLLYMTTFFVGPHLSGVLGSVGQNVGFLLFLSGIAVIGSMMQFPTGIAGKAQDLWQAYLFRKAAAATDAIDLGAVPPATGGDGGDRESVAAIERSATVWGFASIGIHQRVGRRGQHTTVAPVAEAVPLAVENLAVHFGGIAALIGAAIEVGPGQIVGLIGPNGAGKTTLMNAISGLIRPDQGSVRLFGHEVAGQPPNVRARYGLARSFQDASLFAGLTVTETVQVAMVQQERTLLVPAMVSAPRARAVERRSRQRASEIVAMFGLTPWADALTSELSTGMRRICDLAAQVASKPRLLLLDEPTAGVAQREAESFAPLVRRIRGDLGCSILVIEHDMPMLLGLCDKVYAMDAGAVSAAGTPTEVRNDRAVIASYLGTNAAAVARSDQTVTT